jgi:hypothetical protein
MTKIAGMTNGMLTVILLGMAGIAVMVALFAPTAVKAALTAWFALP